MGGLPVVQVHRSLRRGLQLFEQDRLRWLDEAAALGPLTALRIGFATTFVLTDPEAARTVLVTDARSWRRAPAGIVPVRTAVGDNLFTQSDRAWKQLQPDIAPMFRRRALDEMLVGVDEIIADDVGAIPYGRTIDLQSTTARLALRLAAWVLLGDRVDAERADELARHQREVVSWVGAQLGGAGANRLGRPAVGPDEPSRP